MVSLLHRATINNQMLKSWHSNRSPLGLRVFGHTACSAPIPNEDHHCGDAAIRKPPSELLTGNDPQEEITHGPEPLSDESDLKPLNINPSHAWSEKATR